MEVHKHTKVFESKVTWTAVAGSPQLHIKRPGDEGCGNFSPLDI